MHGKWVRVSRAEFNKVLGYWSRTGAALYIKCVQMFRSETLPQLDHSRAAFTTDFAWLRKVSF